MQKQKIQAKKFTLLERIESSMLKLLNIKDFKMPEGDFKEIIEDELQVCGVK